MKHIIVFVTFVFSCLAVPVPEVNDGFIEVIGDNCDNVYRVNLNEPVDLESLDKIERNSGNRYFLFTRNNPTSSQQLVTDNAESVTSSNFDARVPTIVVAHGYLQNRNANLNGLIRDAYLERGDFNVIVVDWSQVAMTSYILAIYGVPRVGQDIGRFLDFLSRTTGASLQSMHLAGFSLGSHVVGNAGKSLNGRLGRVTGLDPYSPVWDNNSNSLAMNDALYVEVIHTNGNRVNPAMGHADFYANGGRTQPGCLTSFCNHSRSYELFSATVKYDHLVGVECSSAAEISANTCHGNTLNMGNSDMNKFGRGLYRVNTGSRYPY